MRKMTKERLRGKTIFVGLDDSLKTWAVCVRSAGMVIHTTSMPAEYSVLKKYFENQYPECRIMVIYEAGFKGFWLHDMLRADGIACIVTPPNKVIQAKDTRVKTDKQDANRLAKMLERDDYYSCHVPDAEQLFDRELSRTYEQVTKNIVRVKNQIRGKLRFHGVRVAHNYGRWYDKDYLGIRTLELAESLRTSLEVLIEHLEFFLSNRDRLQAKLKELCQSERYKRAVEIKMSVPGIGFLTAIRLTLEWGELDRFADGKKLGAFAGLTPSEYSTGETIRRGPITAQSNQQIRKWLIECAWRAIKKDVVLMQKFQAVWQSSGSKKKAIVAVARKIVVRIHALEKMNELYVCGVVQ